MKVLALFMLLTLPIVWGEQPNIVLLVADDLGYGELGCQGNPQIPTPHIDAIAKQGIRFTQAYVTAPNCSPSRAGLLTGKIPMRFGYEFNPIGARNEAPECGLPKEEVTLAEALHDVGYTTGLIGKWHLGGAAAYHPFRHGFDEFYGFTHEGHYFVPPPWKGTTTMLRRKALPGNARGRWQSEDGKLLYTTHMGHNEPDYDANNPIMRAGQPVEEQAHLTDAFSREAVDFIDRHQDKPFFLMVTYNAVHSPLQGADAHMQRFAAIEDIHRRIFAAMLSHLDDSVGTITQAIEERQLATKTLVIFLSDNGGPTRELTSSNAPLRGEKGSMYEGGLRVPMMMRWPGTLPSGDTNDAMIVSTDLFPTLTKLAGAQGDTAIDGIDLMPMLQKGEDLPALSKRAYFWRQGKRTAFRDGPWKLLRHRAGWELYHIGNDPSETTDLASREPERLADMQAAWTDWNAKMAEPSFR